MTGASQSAPSLSDTTLRPEGFDLQGHRGARGLAPENTLPAFRRALEIGVTTLELDVVLSEDGQVVVSHEPWMSHVICSKPSGAPVLAEEERELNLYEMTYSEIERYDCGQRGHPDFPEQTAQPATKPRLVDVFEMAESFVAEHGRAPVFYNVEIKSRPAWEGVFHPEPRVFAERVLRAVHDAGVAARTTIQSFDPRVLRAARARETERETAPRVRFALLVGRGKPGRFDRHLKQLGFTPDIYSPDYRRVDARLLRRARKRDVSIVPWTVNERDAMRRLIDVGVEGLITDYPNVGMEVVRAPEGTSN